MKKMLRTLTLSLLITTTLHAQHQQSGTAMKLTLPDSVKALLTGSWNGIAVSDGKKREVRINITDTLEGSPEITWTIEQTGIFKKPFQSWKWDHQRRTLILENGFFEITPGHQPGKITVTISRHDFKATFGMHKVKSQPAPYQMKNISFNNKDVKLAGTITVPRSKNKMPAIIFLHGSGYGDRWDWAPYFADMFSKMGIVCLFFDKRGCGASTGNWIASSLDDLSEDANRAMEYVKTLDFIEKDRIGFWGFSQSGWVSTNTLATNKEVAFLMITSGGAVSPREIEIFGYTNNLLYENMNHRQVDSALVLVDSYFDYLSARLSLEQMKEKINLVKSTAWYKVINLERILPSEKNRKNWSWVANWDPLPSIRQIDFPVLLMFGATDRQTNSPLAIERWKSALPKDAIKKSTIKLFPGANHGIRIGEHAAGVPIFWQDFAPEYVSLVRNWAKEHILKK